MLLAREDGRYDQVMELNSLKFKAGSEAGSAGLELTPATVLILVGPNNSGKSLALREIESWCVGQNRDRLVVEDVSVSFPDQEEEALDLLDVFKTNPPSGQYDSLGHIWIGQHTFRGDPIHQQVRLDDFKSWVVQGDTQRLRQILLRLYTQLLIDSEAFRAKVRDKIGGANPDYQRLFPEGDVVAADWEVVYAIIGPWNRESASTKLPFFSKVNLREFRRRLRRMGFRVTLARVPVIDP